MANNAMSNYAVGEVLDHILNVGSWTAPTTNYMALCTATVTDAHTGTTMAEQTETAQGYARQTAAWSASSSRAIKNNGAIAFTSTGTAWAQTTHFAIMDGDTEGADDILFKGALTTAKTVGAGDTLNFATDAIVITVSASS